jgi:hypothetical protein
MTKAPRKQLPTKPKSEVETSKPGRRARKRPYSEPEPLPEYLKHYDGPMTISNRPVEDLIWIGEDGSLDPEAVLEKEGYEPEGALRIILGTIVEAHPDADKRTPRQRIDAAEAALVGKRRGRGNVELSDEDLLREVGRRYFALWWEHRDLEIDVGPIVAETLNDPLFSASRRDQAQLISEVRRLQRKFNKERDRILSRVTTDPRWKLPEFYRRILRIISELKALGIAIDDSALRSRIGF